MRISVVVCGFMIALWGMVGCAGQHRCQQDNDCYPGEQCTSGACEKREACAPGQVCGTPSRETNTTGRQGQNNVQLVCVPGERQCDGNTAITCSADGLAWRRLDCGAFHQCQAGLCARKLPTKTCGNGKVEGNEQCDDGNTDSGDGCSRYCIKEEIMRWEAPDTDQHSSTFVLGSFRCRDAAERKRSLDNPNTLYIKISPVVCRTNGQPITSLLTVRSHVDHLNRVFASARISFYMGEVRWEDSADHCEVFYNTESTATLNRYTLPNAISVFYASNISGGSFSIGGFANLSGVVLNARSFSADNILAHELGHSFGLDHPHACRHGKENTQNCSTAGDQLCDTPADPGPAGVNGLGRCSDGSVKNGSCVVRNCQIVSCGGARPLINNLMSYYHCGTSLTQDQLATVRCVALNDQAARVKLQKPCTQDSDCGAGTCRSGTCTGGTSNPPGSGCTTDAECGSGRTCDTGSCVSCSQNGATAAQDSLCCSKERDGRGRCCQGAACCGTQNNSEFTATGECRCKAGFTWTVTVATNDFRCKPISGPTCQADGAGAATDSACCSQERDDQGRCCTGKACCALRNHSYTGTGGSCQCQTGYEWVTPGDSSDRRCRLIPAPSCKNDGASAATSSECCSRTLDDAGKCCTGNSCCSVSNFAQPNASGGCGCLAGYERVQPGSATDVRCRPKSTTTPTQFSCTSKLVLKGHTGLIATVDVSPDGKYIASASYDRTVKVWDAATGQLIRTHSGLRNAAMTVQFSPNSQELAAGDFSGSYYRWDLASGNSRLHMRMTAAIRAVAYHPGGRHIITGTARNATIWEIGGNGISLISSGVVRDLAYNGTGSLIAAARQNKTAEVFDGNTRSKLFTLSGHAGPVFSVSISANDSMIATGSGALRLWDAKTGASLRQLSAHSGGVYDVHFHPKKSLLWSAGYDKTIKLWDPSNGQLKQTLTGHTGPVYSVSSNADGSILASGSQDNTVRVWSCQ